MKKQLLIFSIVSLLSLTFNCEAKAPGGNRGGGGGKPAAGGGGRAAGGGGRSVQRSPSMSRASRPSPVTRPQVHRANVANPQFHRSNVSSKGGRTGGRNNIQQFMKNKPPRQAQQQRNLTQARKGGYQNAGNAVRNNIGSHYASRGNWFNQGFWDRHNYHPPYYNNSGNGWGNASALGLGGWLGWQSAPYYYDYDEFGDSNDSGDFYADNPNNPSGYSQESQELALAPPNSANDEWMPLGVFSVAEKDESIATPNMFVQLALNKNGDISGTFYNATTDQTYPLEGWVDPNSQLAAWKIANNDASPIVETGIYNLTQAEVPVRLYFPNSTSQDRLLIRIER